MKLNFTSAPISLTCSVLSKMHYYSLGYLTVAIWILSHWILRLLNLCSRPWKGRGQDDCCQGLISKSLTQEIHHVVPVELLLVWKPLVNEEARWKGNQHLAMNFGGKINWKHEKTPLNKTKSKYSNRQMTMKANKVNNCFQIRDQGKQSKRKKINCFILRLSAISCW